MSDSKVVFVIKSNDQKWLKQDQLEAKGYRAVVLNGGFDALNELISNGADIVVAETNLPDISGFQLCSLIKSNDRSAYMPFVLLKSDSTGDEPFWTKAAYADEIISVTELIQGVTTIHELLDRNIKKGKESDWSSDKAKGLLAVDAKLASKQVSKSYGTILDVLLIERLINRIMRALSGILEPRRQFLDAYHQLIGSLFSGDLVGLVVADQHNPWLSIKSKEILSREAYDQLIAQVLEKMQITAEPHIDYRGEVQDEGSSIEQLEILPVTGDRSGIGALFFGSYTNNPYDATTRAFISQLQLQMQPIFKLLLAKQEIEELQSREQYRANVDSLTGLYNLEFLVGFLQQQLLFSFRQRLPVGLAIIDVDELGQINEEYGYDMGDAILTAIANRLLAITRSSDLIARYGGDEFAVVLPNTDILGAKVLGEKVRSDIEQLNFMRGKKGPKVTVSVGCANFNMEDLNPETILRDAKVALQKAKEEGRNTVAM